MIIKKFAIEAHSKKDPVLNDIFKISEKFELESVDELKEFINTLIELDSSYNQLKSELDLIINTAVSKVDEILNMKEADYKILCEKLSTNNLSTEERLSITVYKDIYEIFVVNNCSTITDHQLYTLILTDLQFF